MDLPILFKKTYKQFGPKNGGLGTHQEPHVPHIESEEMAWQNVFQTFDTKPPMGFFNNPRILTLTILLMVFSIRRSPVDYRYPAFWTDTYPIPKVGTFEDADYLFPVWNGYVLPFRWRVGNFIPQFTKVSRDFWSILSPPNAGLQRNIYPRSFWKSQHSWICFFWWLEEIG